MNYGFTLFFFQSRVLPSQLMSGQSGSLSADDVSSKELSSVLSVISQAETALHLRQQEVQVGQRDTRIYPIYFLKGATCKNFHYMY